MLALLSVVVLGVPVVVPVVVVQVDVHAPSWRGSFGVNRTPNTPIGNDRTVACQPDHLAEDG